MPNKLRNLVNNLFSAITSFFTPDKASWHYRLIESAVVKPAPKNLLLYWGFCVPVGLPMGLALNVGFFFRLWFCGTSVDIKKIKNLSEGDVCLPYRMTNSGRIKVFTPFGLAIVSIPIYMGIYILYGSAPNIASFALLVTPLLLLTKKDNSKGTRSLEKQGHPAH